MQYVWIIEHAALGVLTALPITTNQNITATERAVGLNLSARGQANVITLKQDTATGLNHGIRGQGTRLANNAPGQFIDGAGGQQNLAGVHLDRMAVFNQGIDERGLNLYPAPLPSRSISTRSPAATAIPAIGRHDQAFVDYFRRQ